MANWQWSSEFHTPVTVTATSTTSGYAATRVTVLDNHPLIRSWRSTTKNPQDLILDFAVGVPTVAVAILNTNFLTIELASSSDNITYTNYPSSPFTISQDHDSFYKIFVLRTVTFRWLRVRIPLQPATNNATYFEIGQVVVLASINTFPTNPMPDLVETIGRPYLRSGTTDVAPVGLNRLTSEVQMLVPMAQQTQHREIALLGQHTPILIYKNAGQSQQVTLNRYRSDIQARIGGTTFSVNPTFLEMV